MRLLPLITPTVNSTTVSGSSYSAYNAGTTYADGDNVKDDGTVNDDGLVHEYESLQNSNTGNALTDATYWLDLGPQNADRMFDTGANTATSDTSSITVEIAPGARFDRVALLGLVGATSVSIEVVNSGTTLYDETYSLKDTSLGAESASWYEYFFGDKSAKTIARLKPITLVSREWCSVQTLNEQARGLRSLQALPTLLRWRLLTLAALFRSLTSITTIQITAV